MAGEGSDEGKRWAHGPVGDHRRRGGGAGGGCDGCARAAPARRSRRRGGVRGRRAGGALHPGHGQRAVQLLERAHRRGGLPQRGVRGSGPRGVGGVFGGDGRPGAGRDLRGCRPGPGACVLRRLGPRVARGGRGASLPAGQQGDERARRAAGGCGGLRCGGGVRAARRAARRARPSGRPLPPPRRRRDGGARRRRGARHGRAHGARAAAGGHRLCRCAPGARAVAHCHRRGEAPEQPARALRRDACGARRRAQGARGGRAAVPRLRRVGHRGVQPVPLRRAGRPAARGPAAAGARGRLRCVPACAP